MRRVVIGAFLVLAVGALAAPASAHAKLVASAPGDGATVAEPVPAVILEFDQLVGLPQITITAPDGQPLTLGPLPGEGQRFVQNMPPLTQAGVYTVAWQVVSLDRDPITGQFTFTYTGPLAAPAPAPAPAPPPTPAPSEPSPAAPPSPTTEPEPSPSPEPAEQPSPDPAAAASSDGATPLLLILGLGALVVVAAVGFWLRSRRT